ncbi:hypothetical protein ACLOJK_012061 [Asimina triloba]
MFSPQEEHSTHGYGHIKKPPPKISIKQQDEEHHHDDYGDESRMITTAKKRKREHVDMPFNCKSKIRSPTSSSSSRGRGCHHRHHHGPSYSNSANLDLQQTTDGQLQQTPSEPSLARRFRACQNIINISGFSFALKGEWRRIVEKNGFAAREDTIRVYAFKYGKRATPTEDQNLGFVVTRTLL